MSEPIIDSTLDKGFYTKVGKLVAQVVSYFMHPLFVPCYVTFFLLFIHPYVFSGFDPLLKIQRLGSVFVNMAFIPGFAVFLMRRLNLVESMQLKTNRERIIPYAAAIIFYFWGWYVLSRQADSPAVFVDFLQGCFFGVSGAWIININSKISMHTTAMGGLVAFMILFTFQDEYATGLYLAISILIAGSVGMARLMVSDHSRLEINQGYIIGILAQLVAWWL